MKNTPPQPPNIDDRLKWIERLSALMDDRFRIPGTDYRFGLDAIIGLVPYAGDLTGFAVSGSIIAIMLKHGTSGKLILKMLGNILFDSVIGAVPILGDIFDFSFRANRRNVNLLKEHYENGEHNGSAWGYILGFIIVILALIVVQIYFLFQFIQYLIGLI